MIDTESIVAGAVPPGARHHPPTRHFFVDESGDLTLFDRRGRSMVGRSGVSTCFMVGVAEISNPAVVTSQLDLLRADMLADLYFARAASMQPECRKTALTFHAKDDLPEVRWRVFDLLRRRDIRFAAAVRRKSALESQSRVQFPTTGQRWHPIDVYTGLVTQLFAGRFGHDCHHHVTFATCSTINQDAMLVRALEQAREESALRASCVVTSERPLATAGLQVVDYYLWAVQRLFERGEGRFLAALASQIDYIWDLDDTREHATGMRYVGPKQILKLEEALPPALARPEDHLEHPA